MTDRWIKDPDATLDWAIDWTAWLATDETIATSTWTVPDGLTQGTGTQAASSVDGINTIWLSGGTDGDTYHITNEIVTSSNRTDDRSFDITIRER